MELIHFVITLKSKRKPPTYPLIVAGQHHAHAETHALVVVHNVGHDLAGGGHRNPLLVPQLVDATLLGQHPIPVDAIGSTSGQRSQQVIVDLHNLLHGLRADELATGGTGIHSQDDSALEPEPERRGTVVELHLDSTRFAMGLQFGQILRRLFGTATNDSDVRQVRNITFSQRSILPLGTVEPLGRNCCADSDCSERGPAGRIDDPSVRRTSGFRREDRTHQLGPFFDEN